MAVQVLCCRHHVDVQPASEGGIGKNICGIAAAHRAVGDVLGDRQGLLGVDEHRRPENELLRVVLKLVKDHRLYTGQDVCRRRPGQAGLLHQLAYQVVAHAAWRAPAASLIVVYVGGSLRRQAPPPGKRQR